MKIKETIGIDISKLDFDVRIHGNQMFECFKNSDNGFQKLLTWVYRNSVYSKDEILFVFEHTGLYSYGLSVFLTSQDIPFALVSGLEIKRSLGISRGKEDKIDATKIALYGYRLRDEIKPYELPTQAVMIIKRLLSLRDRLVKQRAGYKATLKEQKRILAKKNNKVLFEAQEKVIVFFSKQIDKIQKELQDIVKRNKQLKEQYDLITSIKGVGCQTALFLIAYTNGFTKFNNARKFACYCGIAPFPNSSGTSLRGRTRVSHLANKKVKSLLDLCAKSAIQNNIEMKNYYTKRVEKGKNKMSTINIIRNKLLSRIFAVIERKTPYIDLMKYAA
ncbi:MAG: IS110 family transposase [Nitrosopumilus sp.]|nr:IS110 family transposase [Nitrosopumilus sp.]